MQGIMLRTDYGNISHRITNSKQSGTDRPRVYEDILDPDLDR